MNFKTLVNAGALPIRLDRFIRLHYPNLTQGILEKSIRNKLISVENTKIKSGTRLINGVKIFCCSSLDIYANSKKSYDFSEASIAVANKIITSIIYENDYCIVINKPSGLATQLGTKLTNSINCGLNVLNYVIDLVIETAYPDNSLECNKENRENFENMKSDLCDEVLKTYSKISKRSLEYIISELSTSNFQLCYKLVHRLDLDTTGGLIIAKHNAGAVGLHHALKNKLLSKYYAAVLEMKNREYSNVISNTLNSEKKLKINYGEEVSLMQLISSTERHLLCLFKLISGKKHQLRRHACLLGAPILFDKKYSDLDANIMNENYNTNEFSEYQSSDYQSSELIVKLITDESREWDEIIDHIRKYICCENKQDDLKQINSIQSDCATKVDYETKIDFATKVDYETKIDCTTKKQFVPKIALHAIYLKIPINQDELNKAIKGFKFKSQYILIDLPYGFRLITTNCNLNYI